MAEPAIADMSSTAAQTYPDTTLVHAFVRLTWASNPSICANPAHEAPI
jgi:hypothetical protein